MTNEEAKQQAIKNAYGEYWELVKNHVDSNGFLKYGDIRNETIGLKDSEIEITDYNFNIDFEVWRPKQLQGIESNNKWIRIESENDLPKDDCKCWVITSSGEEYMALYLDGCQKFWELMDLDFQLYPTHYMPIVTPDKPVY
jgi:hypothetical protein